MTAYAGIGSRQTPTNVLAYMTKTAAALDTCGYVLRSGGANGADTAFEAGAASGRSEIFLPWKRFNGNPSPLFLENPHLPMEAAIALAKQFHPAWDKCSPHGRLFHARNGFQILGPQLDDPVGFVICWTPDGKNVGGTAQALRITRAHGIPITNLGSRST